MSVVRRTPVAGLGAVGVLVLAGGAWAVGVHHHHSPSVALPVMIGPASLAAPGTPCVLAKKVSLATLERLDRPFPVVTPSPDDPGLARFRVGWTCGYESAVFLEYGTVQIEEGDATPFNKDPDGAAGYFVDAAADGDGHTATFDGYPGLVTLAGHGDETNNAALQVVVGGWLFGVRSDDKSISLDELTAITDDLVDQISSSDQAPTR